MERLLIIFLISLSIMIFSRCSQERPSEDPPIHLNPNMDDQPKYEAMEESQFFIDKSSARMPVDGTLARGQLQEPVSYFQGKYVDGRFIKKAPVAFTESLFKRGQERYDIYCTPCHGRSGYGQGIVVKKGFLPPPSFHLDRLRDAADGYIFDVISNGIRNMPSYKYQIPVADRWAIVAYFRALQRSQNATKDDIPEDVRETLK
jgi:mono/diheme cytochrome c family protein